MIALVLKKSPLCQLPCGSPSCATGAWQVGRNQSLTNLKKTRKLPDMQVDLSFWRSEDSEYLLSESVKLTQACTAWVWKTTARLWHVSTGDCTSSGTWTWMVFCIFGFNFLLPSLSRWGQFEACKWHLAIYNIVCCMKLEVHMVEKSRPWVFIIFAEYSHSCFKIKKCINSCIHDMNKKASWRRNLKNYAWSVLNFSKIFGKLMTHRGLVLKTLFSPASLWESESGFSTNEKAIMNHFLIDISHFWGIWKVFT